MKTRKNAENWIIFSFKNRQGCQHPYSTRPTHYTKSATPRWPHPSSFPYKLTTTPTHHPSHPFRLKPLFRPLVTPTPPTNPQTDQPHPPFHLPHPPAPPNVTCIFHIFSTNSSVRHPNKCNPPSTQTRSTHCCNISRVQLWFSPSPPKTPTRQCIQFS